MNKIRIILINEIVTIISRPSFWLVTIGIPLLASLLFGGISLINRDSGTSQAVSQVFTGPLDLRPEGYVDLSGLFKEIPASIPPGALLAFLDEQAARAALEQDEIASFYIVPKNYLQSGEILYIRPDLNPLAGDQSSLFQWALEVNLMGGDMLRTSMINGPLDVQDVSLAPASTTSANEDNTLAYWLPYGITMLFYFLIMGSASLLLSNISKEKENRVIEILLNSVTPLQLLTGKIVGLGLVGLLQTILWFGTGFVLMNLSGRVFSLPSDIHLPVSLVAWGIVFFVLGYAVYASLMAGLGALAPNLREASQVTFVIMIPLFVPLFFSSTVFATDPNGRIATGLSLFPLSTPVAMMARLAAGGVPWWQPLLAAVLLSLTAILIVRAVAGMFRAQSLLSGQPIKTKTFLMALIGKE
jgi:ABC-2 type transport system permease protein